MHQQGKDAGGGKGSFAGVILIIVGSILLLLKIGVIERALVAQWWPLLLIAIGAWLVLSRSRRRAE